MKLSGANVATDILPLEAELGYVYALDRSVEVLW
jgi:hypothetical protein